jgi:hypothetical protein
MPLGTFPFTPGFSFFSERRYKVETITFDDRSEQRFLEASAEGRRLVYDFGGIGSATAAAVCSWFLASGGPETPFVAMDHTDASTHVVRFATNEMARFLGPANVHGLDRIEFECSSQ